MWSRNKNSRHSVSCRSPKLLSASCTYTTAQGRTVSQQLLSRRREAAHCCSAYKRGRRGLLRAQADEGHGHHKRHATPIKVATFSSQAYEKAFLVPAIQKAFPGSNFFEARLDAATAPLAQGYEAACLFVNDNASGEVLEQLAGAGVRFIAMRCAGFDKVDLPAAERLGIQVARVPSYSPHSVAEHAVAMLLCLNRNLHLAYNRVRSGDYSLSGLEGWEVKSKTIGVLGTGAIGCAAVSIFKGFGSRVLAHDLERNPAVEELGAEYVSREQLLRESDVISLHLPLVPSTRNILCAESFAAMKPGAVVVNVSRGGLIDTDAALDALESGKLRGLAMDVYDREGDLFFTDYTRGPFHEKRKGWDRKLSLLMALPNVLVTPHSAFLTEQALSNIAETTIENLQEFASSSELTHAVRTS